MASKYYQGTTDITSICEPKYHDAAPGFGTEFTGEGPFQKAGTDTTNEELSGYIVDGTPVTTVKKGYYPTQTDNCANAFWSSGTPGTYKVSRTDSALTIGETSYGPSDFRNGKIPCEVIVLVVGGGGGGGGNGYFSPGKNKSGYARVPGGAGGGGGFIVARVDLTDEVDMYIEVGAGGAGGTSGSSSKQSSGNSGSSGGMSGFGDGNYWQIYANGGYGGSGGVGNTDSGTAGTGGLGGSGARNTERHGMVREYRTGQGGRGCDRDNTTRSGVAKHTWVPTEGTGAPEAVFVTNKNWGDTCQTNDDNGESWYSGGCSYGDGAHYYNGFYYYGDGIRGGGGGGAGYMLLSPGATGFVCMCY